MSITWIWSDGWVLSSLDGTRLALRLTLSPRLRVRESAFLGWPCPLCICRIHGQGHQVQASFLLSGHCGDARPAGLLMHKAGRLGDAAHSWLHALAESDRFAHLSRASLLLYEWSVSAAMSSTSALIVLAHCPHLRRLALSHLLDGSTSSLGFLTTTRIAEAAQRHCSHGEQR